MRLKKLYPTINMDELSGDKRAFIVRQKIDRFSNLTGVGSPAHWNWCR
jgi:hypothetical protein